MAALFALGEIWTTPRAAKVLQEAGVNPASLLLRHVTGDWGDLGEQHKEENKVAVVLVREVQSAYTIGQQTVWVVTNRHRTSTAILLPEDQAP